jgi:hypothetical protein
MNDQRRQEIEQRWQEIDRELAAIANCKTNQLCNPPAREAELLIEQDALEVEPGANSSAALVIRIADIHVNMIRKHEPCNYAYSHF